MGQESSSIVDEDTPTQTLKSRTLAGVADYIKDGKARKIVVMNGAGVSTSAGIPDFRSPDTGLYANLAKLDLPYPEAVFDISFFRENPNPFYALAHELYPGKYRPTIAHCLVKLLWDKGLLLKCFTQNIDCLEREAGVPDEMMVEAHGSFATQRCIECKTEFSAASMKEAIEAKEVPHCTTPQCNGLVKPDIVFFGEQLPEVFHQNRSLPAAADLAIIMGTSLSVQPFASLPSFCSEGTPRLLINRERVGGLGSRTDDVLLLGDCDEGARKLAAILGWSADLDTLYQKFHNDEHPLSAEEQEKDKDRAIDDEIRILTADIDETLKLSKKHSSFVHNQLNSERTSSTDAENGSTIAAEHSTDALSSSKSPNAVKQKQDVQQPSEAGDQAGGLGHVFPQGSFTS